MTANLESDLIAWSATPLGAYLLEHESTVLQTRLPRLPGSSLLWLGFPGTQFERSWCMHRERVLVLNDAVPARSTLGDRFDSYLSASAGALPLASASHHAVVVQHAFDLSTDVHEAVREAARVMCLGGQLLVLGFNPFSLWGARRRLATRWSQAPWRGPQVSAGRMADWLRLLGFRMLETCYSVYRLPMGSPRRPMPLELANGAGLPIGAVYLLHARKEGPAMNIIRPARPFPRPRMVPVTAAGRLTANMPYGDLKLVPAPTKGDGQEPR